VVKLIDFTFLVFWIITFLVFYFRPEFFDLFIIGCYAITILFAIFYGLSRKIDFVTYPNSQSFLYAFSSAFVPFCAFTFSELIETDTLGQFMSFYLVANTVVTTFSLVFNRFIFSHNATIIIAERYYRRFMAIVLFALFSLSILAFVELIALPALILIFLIGRMSYTFIEGMYFNGHMIVGNLRIKVLIIGKYFCALLLLGILGVNVNSFFVIVAMPQLLFVLCILAMHNSGKLDA